MLLHCVSSTRYSYAGAGFTFYPLSYYNFHSVVNILVDFEPMCPGFESRESHDFFVYLFIYLFILCNCLLVCFIHYYCCVFACLSFFGNVTATDVNYSTDEPEV